MAAVRAFDPAGSIPSGGDDLALPRPPGAIRRFWARRPLLTDIVIAVVALLCTLPTIVLLDPPPGLLPTASGSPAAPSGPLGGPIATVSGVLSILACVALVWRRRAPVAVFALAAITPVLLGPLGQPTVDGPAALIALYTVAVLRGPRTTWTLFAIAAGALLVVSAIAIPFAQVGIGPQSSLNVTTIVVLMAAALIGLNVGNRRRYFDALMARSHQLVREREQRDRLAAIEERTRIAREMHDIVSHSLTVVIALADGAAATAEATRAKEAAAAIGDQARGALVQMRGMLGVLRADGDDTPLHPVAPADPSHLVAAAQRAGYPVTLRVHGDAVPPVEVLLARDRLVQEGLTNAMKHAPAAQEITVTLTSTQDTTEVVIDNDAAPTVASEPGYGLVGLRERVVQLGGSLTAGPTGLDGWRLTARLPHSPPRETERPR